MSKKVDSVRAKWTIDGANTLSEAASMFRAQADFLEELERQGWQLTSPVADDYGFIEKSEPKGTSRRNKKTRYLEPPLLEITEDGAIYGEPVLMGQK